MGLQYLLLFSGRFHNMEGDGRGREAACWLRCGGVRADGLGFAFYIIYSSLFAFGGSERCDR